MGVHDRADHLAAMRLGDILCLPMALKAAIDLKVFDIIAEAGPSAQLTPSEMVAKMSTSNPNAASALERILRVLVTDSILTMSLKSDPKGQQHVYGLTDQSRSLVPDKEGVSVAPLVQMTIDRATVESLYYLKDAVLEGSRPAFDVAHGVDLFEFACKDAGYNKVFQEAMSSASAIALREIFKVYKGFNDVEQVMDVGGGVGTCISAIVSNFPHIRGVNFDLPHVIATATPYHGVEYVEGNMFEGIPSAENIFMKSVLHDWDDDRCVELLKNCWNALPDGGKVIVVEIVVPSILGTDAVSRHTVSEDLCMLAFTPSGKERTAEEFDGIAKAAGFAETKDFPISLGLHVIEFHKRLASKN